MANILINGLKAKTGGGKGIFDNYLELLRKNGNNNVYYVLTPDKLKYNLYETPHIHIIEITSILKGNAFFPILYFRIFPRLLHKYKIDAIFNLGDIIIPTSVPQLYLFQWAYAVYPETGVWDRMSPLSYLTRRTKVKLISKYINYPSIVIAQTRNIKKRLESNYGLKNIVIVPNAVSLENIVAGKPLDFNLPKGKIKLVYVANWAEHKNIEILIPLALKIAEASLPFCIVLTIRPDQNNGAKQFLKRVSKFELNDIIINIGNVPMENIGSLYQQCDALLMPTLLESYGLPYIEALFHKKTILTSDMDFAHDVCGDAAFYFNPHDADDILDTIREASDNQSLRELKIQQGQEQLSNLFSWEQVFARYQQLLQDTITKPQHVTMEKRAYKVCSYCVMDTSDSKIVFDSKGVCDHCNDFYHNVKPLWHTDDLGHQELEAIVSKIKKSGSRQDFDCILGLSGGVDSSYMLHLAVKEFGLRPLVFHTDGGWNSELAVHNINTLIDKLGLDLYTEVINWEEMRDFQLAFFKSGVPHIDIPQDHAFIATMYKFASKYNIKYILNGGNISTECVRNPMEWLYYGTDMAQIRDIIRQFGTVKMETYPFSPIFRHKFYLRYIRGVRVVKPLNYMPYVKAEALKLLEQEYGWKVYPQKHFESRLTKFYEGYWLPERFGFDTRRVQYSSLILTGQMTREEALERLKKPAYDTETINDEFKYIATKLGITYDELMHYFTMPKTFYWDYKNHQSLFKIGAKFLKATGSERSIKR